MEQVSGCSACWTSLEDGSAAEEMDATGESRQTEAAAQPHGQSVIWVSEKVSLPHMLGSTGVLGKSQQFQAKEGSLHQL